MSIILNPTPGSHLTALAGDCLSVTVTVAPAQKGRAMLRTTLGNGCLLRQLAAETAIDAATAVTATPWRDIPLHHNGEGHYTLRIPLTEVGCFELTAFFKPEDGDPIEWPKGGNCHIKVEPSRTAAGNTLYNAFVRQFGPNRSGQTSQTAWTAAETALDGAGYSVIPPSGTFRDLEKEIPFIINTLGFRYIQLLPIFPLPTVTARMGRFGSPFASLDFFAVDSALAQFDRAATPLQQFRQLIHTIHRHGGRVILDVPVEHTGWYSRLQNEHPEWFRRTANGEIASPGAWGVTWEDLCQLDFSHKELWDYLADVFLHWCAMGVEGFRCDAGYMVPGPVWSAIIANVRMQYPDTLFLLEGLGGSLETTQRHLSEAGLNWAYSESFQQFGAAAQQGYLNFAVAFSRQYGLLMNFAETHDNERLAKRSPLWAAMRTIAAALFAPAGAFAITNGLEWLATEKIDVHGASSLNWGAADNLVALCGNLTALLHHHPAFEFHATLREPEGHVGGAVALLRRPPEGDTLLCAVNPEEATSVSLQWALEDFEPGEHPVDLLTGGLLKIHREGGHGCLEMPPGAAVCISSSPFVAPSASSLYTIYNISSTASVVPPSPPSSSSPTASEPPITFSRANDRQAAKEAMWKALLATEAFERGAEISVEGLVDAFLGDPAQALSQLIPNQYITTWNPDEDLNRRLLLPEGSLLLVKSAHGIQARLMDGAICVQAPAPIRLDDGRTAWLFLPPTPSATLTLKWETDSDEKLYHIDLQILREKPELAMAIAGRKSSGKLGLCVTSGSSYALVSAAWGEVHSKYEALLAANLTPQVPVDRTVLFTRCRAWLVSDDFSQELSLLFQTEFHASYDNVLRWQFAVPFSTGATVRLSVWLSLDRHENRGTLRFMADGIDGSHSGQAISLILRPDVEARSHHQVTKAYVGPEQQFPLCVHPSEHGFVFAPAPNASLELNCANARFTVEGQWIYQHPYPVEAERGMEAAGDLFSPGFFTAPLTAGCPVDLNFAVNAPLATLEPPQNLPRHLPLSDALRHGLEAFVVRRNQLKTVIAGYPWFLDWGRDTLICLRGLIQSTHVVHAKDIIHAFASMESQGTLPNMLCGNDNANRDTSDAPLWLFVATHDLLRAVPSQRKTLLEMDCGGRTLLQVLESIAVNYWRGTPNGIHVDSASGLVFSPAHFTWMDTNYPAATPREGYPVEIQALWIHALDVLSELTGEALWGQRAALARDSLKRLFIRPDDKGLVDCLVANSAMTAADATPDSSLRPNQLLAITMNALDETAICRYIVEECKRLVIPSALRSLAPCSEGGHYRGRYTGDEDSSRKLAYHNGTGWHWLLPSFCEALAMTWPERRHESLCYLASAAEAMTSHCIGFLPEICDGDAPHAAKGCCAQAWSMTEGHRVLTFLLGNYSHK